MNNLTKYILFVFTKNDNPKEFTEQIADELTVISDVPNVNYYFGPESSVFTISTLDSFEDIKDYIDMILGIETITYVLLPYTPDKLSYSLPTKVSEHLFNDGVSDYMSDKTSNSDPFELEVRNVIRNQIKNDFFFDLSSFEDDDDEEWTDIDEIKNKKRKPTFDEVFDKLAESGVDSLSQEELLILKKLSN
jgi:hypothetical protein